MTKQKIDPRGPARIAARTELEKAMRGLYDATQAQTGKMALLASAIDGCITAGIVTDDVRKHARRATIAHVMGCKMNETDQYDVHGAKRPDKLETALKTFRVLWHRALSMAVTGEKSARKAKAKRTPRAAEAPTTPTTPNAAPVPAHIGAVNAPMLSKPEDCRNFLCDVHALLGRFLNSSAKALSGEQRAAIEAARKVLAPVIKDA